MAKLSPFPLKESLRVDPPPLRTRAVARASPPPPPMWVRGMPPWGVRLSLGAGLSLAALLLATPAEGFTGDDVAPMRCAPGFPLHPLSLDPLQPLARGSRRLLVHQPEGPATSHTHLAPSHAGVAWGPEGPAPPLSPPTALSVRIPPNRHIHTSL